MVLWVVEYGDANIYKFVSIYNSNRQVSHIFIKRIIVHKLS